MHRDSTGQLLRQHLQQLLLTIRLAVPALAGTDGEALHRLRTALRQLRCLLRMLQSQSATTLLVPLQAGLGEFTRRSNPWRDREVRLQLLQAMAAQADTQAFARWRRREAGQIARGRSLLSQQGAELELLLQAAWQYYLPLLAGDSKRLHKALLHELRRSRRRYRRQRAVLRQQPLDATQAHRTRLLAKRLRYQVEVCAGVVGKRWRQRAARARLWQQRLGDSRDHMLLLQSLQRDQVPLPAVLRRQLGLVRSQ